MYDILAELEKYGPVIKVRGYKMKRLYDGSHYKDFCGIAEYTQYNKSWDINNFNDK